MEQIPLKSLEAARRVYSVSEVNALARDLLESSYPDLWMEGEISNLRSPGSGHLYFTLKDSASQIAAVLFRTQALALKFQLEDHLKVVVRGRVTLYEARGTFQMICQTVEPAGRGSLQLAFEQLKRRLEAEGLFDPARKRRLPLLPRRIGVITSPSGAALRDFLHVLGQRFANLHVTIHPVRVQGEGAAAEIAEAIRRMNRREAFDVLVVCRGGGSLEDLWCFNEEVLARAVAASDIPVLSAVGHEIDFTLCDFAADLRAATPSAAAEQVIAAKLELEGRIRSLQARLFSTARLAVSRRRERVAKLSRSRALLLARARVEELSQRLDEARDGVREGLRELLAKRRRALQRCRESVNPRILGSRAAEDRRRLGHLVRLAQLGIQSLLQRRRESARATGGLLDSLSPLAVLDRGYALCLDPRSGHLVTDSRSLPAQRTVEVRLRRGRIQCDIREVMHAQDKQEGG
jgi:exodeoxyribonuclease VII large subunit